MSQSELTGGCFCGAVRYRVTGDASNAFFCHCESCRRAAAAPYVAWIRITEHDFEVTQGVLAEHHSSPGVIRGFCARCGTGITYQQAQHRPVMDFLLATLDAPERVTPAYHIRTAEKVAWIELNDALPKYEGWRPKDG